MIRRRPQRHGTSGSTRTGSLSLGQRSQAFHDILCGQRRRYFSADDLRQMMSSDGLGAGGIFSCGPKQEFPVGASRKQNMYSVRIIQAAPTEVRIVCRLSFLPNFLFVDLYWPNRFSIPPTRIYECFANVSVLRTEQLSHRQSKLKGRTGQTLQWTQLSHRPQHCLLPAPSDGPRLGLPRLDRLQTLDTVEGHIQPCNDSAHHAAAAVAASMLNAFRTRFPGDKETAAIYSVYICICIESERERGKRATTAG